jgi:hypothetical protein
VHNKVSRLSKQVQKIKNFITLAQYKARYLNELSILEIKRPQSLIARYLPIMRQNTSYQLTDERNIASACKIYEQIMKSMKQMDIWIPIGYFVDLSLENIKMNFYIHLLQPHSKRLFQLAEDATKIATRSPSLSCTQNLDLGGIYWHIHFLTGDGKWKEKTMAQLEQCVQSDCPDEIKYLAYKAIEQLK